jgi:transposase-like protein
VLTPPILKKVQDLLDLGQTIPEIARELDLKADTLRKAVKAGKLHKPEKKSESAGISAG